MQNPNRPTVFVLATSRSSIDSTDSGSQTTNNGSLQLLRKACDSCRRRKTRCDRKNPCNACKISYINCEYLVVHQRRGPKRRRTSHNSNHGGNGHHRSNTECSAPRENYPSPSLSETAVSGTLAPETFGNPTSGSIIEISSDDDRIHTREDASESYHIFTSDNIFNSIAPAYREGNTSNTESLDIDSNAFFPEYNLPSRSPQVEPTQDPPVQAQFRTFAPYIKLFIEYIYPIMPVFDHKSLLQDLKFRVGDPRPLSPEEIAIFSALSAAVIAQLNLNVEGRTPIQLHNGFRDPASPDEQPHGIDAGDRLAAAFVTQSLEARQQTDFIESPNINCILTSFFLFAYYGHLERHTSAWYYLRQAISFALEMKLDVEEVSPIREVGEFQRRKRIFWLLFVTERGYALQQRRAAVLQPSISLPLVFDSEDPCLLYGFVNLINLFKLVDSKFSYMWVGDSRLNGINQQPRADPQALSSWLVSFQDKISRLPVPLSESLETQRVDVMVTREWLHMVAWQMALKLGLLKVCGETTKYTYLNIKYPLVLAKDLATVILGTRLKSLESHGIGMEQKISELAMCLTDVMACTCSGPEPDVNGLENGRNYLRVILGLLSKFRGQRSRYLETILRKALPFISSNTLWKQPPTLDNDVAILEGRFLEDETNPRASDNYNTCYNHA
ncbi:hypothetical protein TWF481_000004 [Arthrobotrys musiformis]|uniref:Zn(2)-C6 fungal-type domain-containing protein n=1 Tax=Arthrobotrys musiformis TaxID=47236 RepID=A0AAV9WMG7_9PEZI